MDQNATPNPRVSEKPKGQPEDLEPPVKDGYRYPHNRFYSAPPNPRVSEKPKGQPEDLEPPIKDGYRYPHNRHQSATPHPKRRGEDPGAGPGGPEGQGRPGRPLPS